MFIFCTAIVHIFATHYMAEQKPDLELLLKNITEGLKKYTVQELSEAILSFFHQKEDHFSEVNFVLNTVAESYSIPRRTLIVGKSGGKIQEARQLAYCLLHYNLGLSSRHIAKRIFDSKWHNSVGIAIRYFKTLDPNIKMDREFKERYEFHQKKLLNFISDNQPAAAPNNMNSESGDNNINQLLNPA